MDLAVAPWYSQHRSIACSENPLRISLFCGGNIRSRHVKLGNKSGMFFVVSKIHLDVFHLSSPMLLWIFTVTNDL